MSIKRISSKDVAREAGVSQATVSYVLNNAAGIKIKPETRQLVLAAAKKLNYHTNYIARSMRLKKASSIGVVTDKNMASYIFMNALEGVKSVLLERNYSITMCLAPHEGISGAEYIKYYNSNLIDGIIFLFTNLSEEEKEYLTENNIPYVMVNAHVEGDSRFQVKTNIENAIEQAVSHLVQNGISEIGFVGNAAEKPGSQRYGAYLAALRERGMPLNEMFVHSLPSTDAEAEPALDLYLDSLPRLPRALFCDSISTGFYALRYAHKRGIKIPRDLAVVSIGTSQFSSKAYPALSAIEAPLYDMGRRGCKMLFDILDGKDENDIKDVIILEWMFSKRESC